MINFSKFNYSQGQKPIIIFYKQVDSNRILPLKSDIENIISSDCCTAMAIDEVKNSDYSLNIDAFKVFILVYSSNFSDIDAIERNWLMILPRSDGRCLSLLVRAIPLKSLSIRAYRL